MRALGLATAALAAAVLATSAGATTRSATGDTCEATGNGTSYTLNISIPAGAPEQGGFAIGARNGAKVTNVAVSGTAGTLSTTNLPANTTGAWMLTTPAAPGSLVANVNTSAPATGFVVVPSAPSASAYFDALSCSIARGHLPSNALTAPGRYVYALGVWRGTVTVPGSGSLHFTQAFAHPNNGIAHKHVALIRSGGMLVSGARTVTLTLRPTAAGQAMLAKRGLVELNLSIVYKPTGGTSSGKLLHLFLHGK